MKFFITLSLVLLCVGIATAQVAPRATVERFRQTLQDLRSQMGSDSSQTADLDVDAAAGEEGERKLKNSLGYTGYYLQTDSLPTTSIHKVTLGRSVNALGSDFEVLGDVFINQAGFDRDRSGITFAFDNFGNLDRLRSEHSGWLEEMRALKQNDLLEGSARYLQAKLTTLFQEYLETLNSDEYREYVGELEAAVSRGADSVYSVANNYATQVEKIKDTLETKGNERLETVHQFQSDYQALYGFVKDIPFDVRSNATGIVDSLKSVGSAKVADTKQLLLEHPSLSKLQKHLLNVEELGIGNTQMGRDELTSIGLPIRGVNYVYNDRALRAEIQAGRRILPRRQYLPVQGLLFPTTDRNTTFLRTLIGFNAQDAGKANLSFLTAKETTANQENVPLSPRRNHVVTAGGEVDVYQRIKALGTVSYSVATIAGPAPTAAPEGGEFLAQSALKAGLGYEADNYEIAVSAFNTGANYVTLANPFLLTDLRGVEARLSGAMFNGKLGGELRVAAGYGTTALTKDNSQWQLLGLLRYAFAPGHSVGIMATPNVFQIETDESAGFSKNNIYQVDVSGRLQDEQGNLAYRLSASNLETGFNWGDTTDVSSALQLTGDVSFDLSQQFRFGVTGIHRIDLQKTSGKSSEEWSYATSLAYQKKVTHELSLRYEKYRLASPGIGLGYAVNYPVSRGLTIRLNVYGHLGDAAESNAIYSSQHSIVSKF